MASSNTGSPHTHDDVDNSVFQNYSMNGKIIICALGILFFIVFIIVCLHIYAKWWWRSSSIRQRALSRLRSSLSSFRETSKASGLAKEIVESLPIFAYMPQLFKEANLEATKPAECAVCLAEFRQDESCKLLPRCKHFFHVGCIDMWFLSNTTCPLCRRTPGMLLLDEEAGYPTCHCSTHVDGGNHEQCQETQRGLQCARGDEEQELGDEDTLLIANFPLQPRKWRRSFSDKFPCAVREGVQCPAASVACWSNDALVTSHRSPVWGSSLSHITIDILRPQKSLVAVSSCPSISSLVSPHRVSPHEDVYPPFLKDPSR